MALCVFLKPYRSGDKSIGIPLPTPIITKVRGKIAWEFNSTNIHYEYRCGVYNDLSRSRDADAFEQINNRFKRFVFNKQTHLLGSRLVDLVRSANASSIP